MIAQSLPLALSVLGPLAFACGCREHSEGGVASVALSNGSAAFSRSARLGPAPPAPSSPPPAASLALQVPGDGLARYAEVANPLSAPCDDPRVVLAVRKQFDRSGRLWVQQALLAHPEFELVSEKASKPLQVDVYETIYGTKNFARLYPGQPLFSEAVVARCGDVNTCNRLAAMFHAVAPAEKIELVCGTPGATTGGFGRVAELAPERLVIPSRPTAPASAVCARLHACAAREGSPLPARFGCVRAAEGSLRECASAENCPRVAACVAQLVK